MLKPYTNLSRKDQMKYEDLTRETLKAMKALGWSMEKSELNTPKNTTRLVQKKIKVFRSFIGLFKFYLIFFF